jgi:hypothetical protein
MIGIIKLTFFVESLAAANAVPRFDLYAVLGHLPLRHRERIAFYSSRHVMYSQVDVCGRLVDDLEAHGFLLASA